MKRIAWFSAFELRKLVGRGTRARRVAGRVAPPETLERRTLLTVFTLFAPETGALEMQT